MRDAEKVVNYAWNRDTLVIAAAGNVGTAPGIPRSRNALSVAATTKTDVRASFSSYGSRLAIAAPGEHVVPSTPGGYTVASGTSQPPYTFPSRRADLVVGG